MEIERLTFVCPYQDLCGNIHYLDQNDLNHHMEKHFNLIDYNQEKTMGGGGGAFHWSNCSITKKELT